jgi:hypothetical protein
MMAYGNRTDLYKLPRVNTVNSFQKLIHCYFGLKVPNIKVAVTGTGRVAHGVLEIMNLLGIHEVDADEYTAREFAYPVYVHLKGTIFMQIRKQVNTTVMISTKIRVIMFAGSQGLFPLPDILINGVYWDKDVPRLFELEDMSKKNFRIVTIADITDDLYGSVPCNIGDATIDEPVYGIDRYSFQRTQPYLPGSVDIMAVGNLPNELPRDASRYFGEQLIKFVLDDLRKGGSDTIEKATIIKDGNLTTGYSYMREYALG